MRDEQITAFQQLVERIADIRHPWEFYGVDDDERCFFCGNNKPSERDAREPDEVHAPDCMWRQANQLATLLTQRSS